jgi:hypothetical protein
MAQISIEFDWWRDPKGYRVAAAEPQGKRSSLVYHPFGIRVLRDHRHALRIIRCGKRLTRYRPLDTIDTLFRVFANTAKSATGVLDFVQRYGPLTLEGLDQKKGETVDQLLVHAETMRDALSYAGGDKSLQALLVGSQVNPLANIKVALVMDPTTSGPKLQLSPSTLLDALWLQLGQQMSGGANIRRCLQCGEWFENGPGAGRRLDAKFCSDEHRIIFNSQKRSKEK